jgi:hypothetical protein
LEGTPIQTILRLPYSRCPPVTPDRTVHTPFPVGSPAPFHQDPSQRIIVELTIPSTLLSFSRWERCWNYPGTVGGQRLNGVSGRIMSLSPLAGAGAPCGPGIWMPVDIRLSASHRFGFRDRGVRFQCAGARETLEQKRRLKGLVY